MRAGRLAGSVLVMAVAPWCVWSQNRVSVVVWNYAEAPHPLLAAAAKTTRTAFLPAHVDLQWRIGEGVAAAPPDDASLQVFVMPQPLNGRRKAELQRAGYALLNPAYLRAYAFLDAVEKVSERTTHPEQEVLACILTHEIGHLLGLRHRRHGAMRADLDAMDMDDVVRGRGFDAAEVADLGRAVAARNCAASLHFLSQAPSQDDPLRGPYPVRLSPDL